MLITIVSAAAAPGRRVQDQLLRLGHLCPGDHVLPPSDAYRIPAGAPDAVVVVLGPDPAAALATLADVRSRTAARVLAIGPGTDPKFVLRAVRAGADEYVFDTDPDADLGDALYRLAAPGRPGVPAGRGVAVLAGSGGSGASTLAVNLAAAWAKAAGDAVLIDFKLETGDLAALLDITPAYTLADLCGGPGPVDRGLFDQALLRHPSGTRLLASPRWRSSTLVRLADRAAEPARVSADSVYQVLNLARAAAPYCVYEVNPTFREEQIQALRMADAVLLVARLDFTSLRNARRMFDHLDSVGVARDRVVLVGNRHGQPESLPVDEAEQALGVAFGHLIPDDPKTMNAATNLGEPAVLWSPTAKVSKSLAQLAATLSARWKAPS